MIQKAVGQISGGIHPQEFKSLSNERKIESINTARRLILPLQQHIGYASTPTVNVGDKVNKGQIVAIANPTMGAYIHAPADGYVEAIESCETGHPSGLFQPAIVINTELNHAPATLPKTQDNNVEHLRFWMAQNKEDLLTRIERAGIVGLGGATFPTQIKLATEKIETLLVNAMECEPYITCDDRMLREHAKEVIEGAQIAAFICGAKEIIFASEDNKLFALNLLDDAIKKSNYPTKMSIVVAPTKYPSGGEKQLIELVLGQQLPSGQLPASIGVLVQNVATLFAIQDAIINENSLTKRLITVTGDLVDKPGNYWIPFGTQLSFLFEYFGVPEENDKNVIFGGPLMGQKITSMDTPITKSTNCIIFNHINNTSKNWLVESVQHAQCIRCGDCEKVCPVNLLPQQLYWFSHSQQWQKLEQQALFDCIECGACAYVCPSEIPLVHYYRFAKSTIKSNQQKQAFSEQAKKRFEFRENRLQRLKVERALKHKKAAENRRKLAENTQQDPSGKQTAINQALARVKQKKAKMNLDGLNNDE